jgi:hypothetical protein
MFVQNVKVIGNIFISLMKRKETNALCPLADDTHKSFYGGGETLNNFLLTGILEWKDNWVDSTCCPKVGHNLKTLTDFNYC